MTPKSVPIGLGIAMAGLAGAVAYFTLKLKWNGPPDTAVDVAMLVLIGSVTLLAICHSKFS